MSSTLVVQLYPGPLNASLPLLSRPVRPNTLVRRILPRKRSGYSGSLSKSTQIRILALVQRLSLEIIKAPLPWPRMPSITAAQSTLTLTFTSFINILLIVELIYVIYQLLSKSLMGWQSRCAVISLWRFGRLLESNNPVGVLPSCGSCPHPFVRRGDVLHALISALFTAAYSGVPALLRSWPSKGIPRVF
jgi:hypothetical protein